MSTSRPSRLSRLPFDERAIAEIALVLQSGPRLAPFQLPGGTVHQLTIPDGAETPTVMLTLWPTIHRVDAISPAATVVFTNVQLVELIEDVEVIFRRGTTEYLIVTRAGKVVVRA